MGQRQFLVGYISSWVRCSAVLFYVLSFKCDILGKFFNYKTSVALLHVVPRSENLQTENLGACFCLQVLEFTRWLLKLTASNSNSFNKSNTSTWLPNCCTSGSSGHTVKTGWEVCKWRRQILHLFVRVNLWTTEDMQHTNGSTYILYMKLRMEASLWSCFSL